MVHRSHIPFGTPRGHTVLVDQHAAHPDRRSLHPAQKTDSFPVQVARLIDATGLAAEDKSMAKHAGWKNRNRDKIRSASRRVINELAKRHFGDVVLSFEHAGEHAG